MKFRRREYLYLANRGHYFIQPHPADSGLWRVSYHGFSDERPLGEFSSLQDCCLASRADLLARRLYPRHSKMGEIENVNSWESALPCPV